MRIVIDMQPCQNQSRYRGIGRYAMGLVQALFRVGAQHEYWVFLNDRFPETIAPVIQALAPVVPLDRFVIASMPQKTAGGEAWNRHRTYAAEVIREDLIARLEPDFLLIISLFEGFHDSFIASIGHRRIKTAVVLHDLIPMALPDTHVSQPEERQRYNQQIDYLQQADLVFSVSDYSRQEAINLVGMDGMRIITISAAAEARFRPKDIEAMEADALRQRLGISRGIIMFTGAVEYRKNLEGLIHAFSLLKEDLRRDYQIVVVGSADGGVRAHLLGLSARLGLSSDDVLITGHIDDDDLITLYNICVVFVFPSIYEGFGLPALEAMACGAPTIGSSTTSIPEVIGRTDALFNPAEPAAIAKALSKTLVDATFREELKRDGLARARRFSWEKTARTALDAMERYLVSAAQSDSAVEAASSYETVLDQIAGYAVKAEPSIDDLIDWANCIARNRVLPRGRYLFIDLTKIHYGKYAASYDDDVQCVLKRINALDRAKPIYFDGIGFRHIESDQARENWGVRSEPINPQPGDVLLAAAAFLDGGAALADAQAALMAFGVNIIRTDGPMEGLLALLTDLDAQMSVSVGEISVASVQCAYLAEVSRSKFPPEHVTVTGHMQGSYSLAIINRTLAKALESADPGTVTVQPVEQQPYRSTEGIPESDRPLFEKLIDVPLAHDKPGIVISQHYPIYVPRGDFQLKLALVVWEESVLPASTIETLEAGFDAVLAGTQFVARALINSGLSKPVITCGQPVEISAYRAIGRDRPKGASVRRFLHVSSCFPRKGIDLLLEAWARAFTVEDEVTLVIKTFPNPHNDCAQRIEALRRRFPLLAPIELINEDMPVERLIEIYRRADIMVLPTRGEGYNLPALEAMAAGIPVIVTGAGGHLDFCTAETARLLAFRFEYSGSHVSSGNSLWLEVDVDDLVAALRESVDPMSHDIVAGRTAQAEMAARNFADHENWVRNFRAALARLHRLRDADAPRIGWFSTWSVHCGIAEYSSYLMAAFDQTTRDRLTIFCDERTKSGSDKAGMALVSSWDMPDGKGWHACDLPLMTAIDRANPDVLVIQHQDGLIRWHDILPLLQQPQMQARPVAIVLHNAVSLRSVAPEVKRDVVAGLSLCSRVLVHTLDDMNLLLSLGLRDNLVLFPHGIIVPDKAAPPVRRMELGTSAPIIGIHGFFLPGKGIDLLLKAGALLRREWPELRLRLVNARFPALVSDAEIERCRALAQSLGLEDAVEWHIDYLPRDRVDELLRGCDLLVLPYEQRTDSASGAVRVALAAQVPVLVSDADIFRELDDAVARMQNYTPEALADAVRRLLLEDVARCTLQNNARSWMKERGWSVLAKRLQGMLHGLVAEWRLTHG